MDLESKLESALGSIDTLVAVADSGATWQTIFEIVSTAYDKSLRMELNDMGIRMEWVNPDTSRQEDTMVFITALLEVREDVVLLLNAIEEMEGRDR